VRELVIRVILFIIALGLLAGIIIVLIVKLKKRK